MKDIVQLFFLKVGFSPLTANECMHELISKALMMTEHYLVTFDLLWHEIYARSVLPFFLFVSVYPTCPPLVFISFLFIPFYSNNHDIYFSPSSVGLSLSLRDFLPRGSGIVTRRPLILQLVNNKAGECKQPCAQSHCCLLSSLQCIWLLCHSASS